MRTRHEERGTRQVPGRGRGDDQFETNEGWRSREPDVDEPLHDQESERWRQEGGNREWRGPASDREWRGSDRGGDWRGGGSIHERGGSNPDRDYRGSLGDRAESRIRNMGGHEPSRWRESERRQGGTGWNGGDTDWSMRDERSMREDRADRPFGGSWQRGPHAGKGPNGYQRSDDRIREDVCDRLTMDPDVDASGIDVQVAKGEVTLTGQVESRRAKRAAEDCIEDVPGVREVHNQLRTSSWFGSGSEQSGQRGQTAQSGQSASHKKSIEQRRH